MKLSICEASLFHTCTLSSYLPIPPYPSFSLLQLSVSLFASLVHHYGAGLTQYDQDEIVYSVATSQGGTGKGTVSKFQVRTYSVAGGVGKGKGQG